MKILIVIRRKICSLREKSRFNIISETIKIRLMINKTRIMLMGRIGRTPWIGGEGVMGSDLSSTSR